MTMRAADAFKEDAPLPPAAVDVLDYLNSKDAEIARLQAAVDACYQRAYDTDEPSNLRGFILGRTAALRSRTINKTHEASAA